MRKIFLFLICIFFTVPAHATSLINDTETEELLTEIVAPLASAANIPDGRLRVHIINSDDFNAFVMGGEDVYVYTGLLTQIKNPSALQAVIAHELGHTLGGHMTQMSARISAEMTRTMLIQALGIGLMVAGGDPSLGAGVLAGSGGIAQQSMLAFTRDEERIADDMGVQLMIDADLDPNGFIDVFRQMENMTGVLESRINPNRINHPLTAERLKNVRDKISKLDSDYKPTNAPTDAQNARFELVRAKLIGYLDSADNVATKYPNSDTTDAALYARAIARMQVGNLDGARVGTMTLISRNPDNPYYYESDLIASIILLVVVVALCVVLCCINIIVGRITLRKMENAKSKDELFSISIICLICCSIVSGIILLCLDENEFEEGKKIESGVSNLEALETKLNKLKSLKESGAISEEEYNDLRKRTIEKEL